VRDFVAHQTAIVSLVVGSIVALCSAPAASSMPSGGEQAVVETRSAAPDFTLNDANGMPFRLSSERGKVVLLDFWATWCTGCKVEIPWFIEFRQKYRAKGLAAVGVAMDEEGWEKVTPYLAEHAISYPIVVGNLNLLQQTFGLDPNLPITLLIDRHGRIADSHQGIVDKDAWENEIVALLKEP
jgi:peroxiredoxin